MKEEQTRASSHAPESSTPVAPLAMRRAVAGINSRPVPNIDLWPLALSKDAAACCMALVDKHGRPPIGYCGPDCERKRRARLIADCIRTVRAPVPRVVLRLDAYDGWEPARDVWDDPTADAALAPSSSSGGR